MKLWASVLVVLGGGGIAVALPLWGLGAVFGWSWHYAAGAALIGVAFWIFAAMLALIDGAVDELRKQTKEGTR